MEFIPIRGIFLRIGLYFQDVFGLLPFEEPAALWKLSDVFAHDDDVAVFAHCAAVTLTPAWNPSRCTSCAVFFPQLLQVLPSHFRSFDVKFCWKVSKGEMTQQKIRRRSCYVMEKSGKKCLSFLVWLFPPQHWTNIPTYQQAGTRGCDQAAFKRNRCRAS